jgi:hypothetical protein
MESAEKIDLSDMQKRAALSKDIAARTISWDAALTASVAFGTFLEWSGGAIYADNSDVWIADSELTMAGTADSAAMYGSALSVRNVPRASTEVCARDADPLIDDCGGYWLVRDTAMETGGSGPRSTVYSVGSRSFGCSNNPCGTGFQCMVSTTCVAFDSANRECLDDASTSCEPCKTGTVSDTGLFCTPCKSGSAPDDYKIKCLPCNTDENGNPVYSDMGTVCEVRICPCAQSQTLCTRVPRTPTRPWNYFVTTHLCTVR